MVSSITEFMESRSGYATMGAFKNAGIHTRTIRNALEKGIITKIKPGLYKLKDYPRDEFESFIDIHTANKNAIICLSTALAYHELTTFSPSKVDVAVPNNTDTFELIYPPMNVYFFRERMYNAGIETIEKDYGEFKVYNMPKTVCDMFRYRNKIGEDLALEGLQNYLKRSKNNLNELAEFMIVCRVKSVMEPYIKAMVAG
jgi:predicted transcriptional regulator of viral defense system